MTKKEAEEYINNTIEHAISLVEYSNYFVSIMKGFADATKEECDHILLKYNKCTTKGQEKEIEKEIQDVLDNFELKIEEFIAAQIQDVADNENEYLKNFVGNTLGITLAIPLKILSMLMLVPMASAGTPQNFGKYNSEKLSRIYKSIISRGYTFGDNFNNLLPEYKSQFNTFDNGLASDSETMGYSLSNEYDRIVYTKNDKKISGYIWNAMLDGNTCIECAALSGTKYEKIEDVPYFPRHNRDRCWITPYSEDTEDVIPESYEEWFEKQDKSAKRKILGKTRFQLYEQGMKIKKFVNNGEITPVKELKEKYPTLLHQSK